MVTRGTNTSVLSVIEDLGDGNDDADADSDDDEDEWTSERAHVDTARFVDVQRRVYISHQSLKVRHVPAFAAICEPATLQRLRDSHRTYHIAQLNRATWVIAELSQPSSLAD